jgi:uncharacterized damage-inducible protein DinB
MNDHIAAQNQRHYERMLEALASIPSEQNTRSLGSLIATLDFLLEALEGADANWKERFRKHWGILEEVNAFALDARRSGFSDEEQKLLYRAVQNLRLLTEEVTRPAG